MRKAKNIVKRQIIGRIKNEWKLNAVLRISVIAFALGIALAILIISLWSVAVDLR